MAARFIRPVVKLSTVLTVLVAVLAVYAFLNTGTSHAESTYKPVTGVKYCKNIGATFTGDPSIAGTCPGTNTENLTPAANADTTTTLDETLGDLNFASVVTMNPGTVSVVATAGAEVGGLNSINTLGTANNHCGGGFVGVQFVLYNVALPSSTSDPRSSTGPGAFNGASTNIAFPQVSGATTVDRFKHWKIGAQAASADGGGTVSSSFSNPNSTLIADGSSLAIQNYPSYLLDLFDPNFVNGVDQGNTGAAQKPVVPKAVYGGISNVVGTMVTLYFAVFTANQLTALPAPLSLINNMGEPSVSVLNDPSDISAFPSTINDFCTEIHVQTELLGTAKKGPAALDPTPAGAVIRQTSPAAGTNFIVAYNLSQRDTDQDSYENSLDTCPNKINAQSPRVADPDVDGMDTACDPSGVNDGTDIDSDLFFNRQDNCPLVINGTQAESGERALGSAPDNGPLTDSIGDACDTGPVLSPSGSISDNGVTYTLTLSSAVANGRFHVITNVVPKCFGVAADDLDGDGYCNTDGDTDEVSIHKLVVHQGWSGPTNVMDTDSDGFSDAVETYLGTDAARSCSFDATGGNETVNNWPIDLTNDKVINISDLSFFVGQINLTVDIGPAVKQIDYTQDGTINISDLSFYVGQINKVCGGAGAPPVWAPQ